MSDTSSNKYDPLAMANFFTEKEVLAQIMK